MNRDNRAAQPPDNRTKMDERLRESFLRAAAVTLRALSRTNVEVRVEFDRAGQPAPESENKQATIPFDIVQTLPDTTIVRGHADMTGFRLRYSDANLHAALRPRESSAGKLFDALEQARCDYLGTAKYAGSLANISAYMTKEKRRRQNLRNSETGHAEDIVRLMMLKRNGAALEPDIEDDLEHWRLNHGALATSSFDRLCKAAGDQRAFAAEALSFIDRLNRPWLPGDAEPVQNKIDGNHPTEKQDKNSASPKAEDVQDKNRDTGAEGTDQGDAHEKRSRMNKRPETDETIESDSARAELEGQDESNREPDAKAEGSHLEGQSVNRAANEDMAPFTRKILPRQTESASSYKVYTKAFDEIVDAATLVTSTELDRYYQELQYALKNQSTIVPRLANKLQRMLMAKQQRDWDFNMEEGSLNPARLSDIIIDPFSSLSFMRERDKAFRDTVVTLLVDNSGSMRRKPILMTAMTASMLASALERCGIKCEILGYTTTRWHGGKSREKWVIDKSPPKPGRLNDLRHIVYKSADVPMRHVRKNLAVMLNDAVLKENIDGEALEWACSRLIARPEERKILIVISDGAPMDDSTNDANGKDLLHCHLKEVVRRIEAGKAIELIGLGIGHDTSRYYKKSKTFIDSRNLGEALAAEITTLFDSVDSAGRRMPAKLKRRAPGP